jgi:hypothetical protein
MYLACRVTILACRVTSLACCMKLLKKFSLQYLFLFIYLLIPPVDDDQKE